MEVATICNTSEPFKPLYHRCFGNIALLQTQCGRKPLKKCYIPETSVFQTFLTLF